jgi:[acyl-carrier-protein] S-malonyltransferase
MKKFAFLFPGQGSQYPGMGRDLAASFAVARHTFEEADDILGERLSSLAFEGPEEMLTLTKYSQPAIYVMSIAWLRTLQSQLPRLQPFVCSGLSLGEYSALHASGRLGFRETLLLIRERARLMNQACEATQGAMAAVLGMAADQLDPVIASCAGVWVANYNCPGQIVISGTRAGIEAASAALKNAGAKRVVPLQVSGAFHSGLMASAQEGLAPWIAKAPLVESATAFVMNVPGDFITNLTDVRRFLVQQVTHSVRWEQGILALERQAKPDLYIEIGSGKTLTGFNRKIGVTAQTLSLEKVEDLEALATHVEGMTCSC